MYLDPEQRRRRARKRGVVPDPAQQRERKRRLVPDKRIIGEVGFRKFAAARKIRRRGDK